MADGGNRDGDPEAPAEEREAARVLANLQPRQQRRRRRRGSRGDANRPRRSAARGTNFAFTYWLDFDAEFQLDLARIAEVLRGAGRRVRPIGLVWQWELSPTTNQTHIQGCLRLDNTARANGLRVLLQSELLPGVHIEVCRGSWKTNVLYCTKDTVEHPEGSGRQVPARPPNAPPPHREGETSTQQGRRTDLERAAAVISAGGSLAQLAAEFPTTYVRYHGGLAKLLGLVQQQTPRTRPPYVLVIYGKTRAGKSRWAFSQLPTVSHWQPPTSSQWWDGYDHANPIVIDDYVGDYPWSFMLRFLDRYPMRLEVKGGTAIHSAELIVITSNLHPRQWYAADHNGKRKGGAPELADTWDDLNPLRARIHEFGCAVCADSWRDPSDPPVRLNRRADGSYHIEVTDRSCTVEGAETNWSFVDPPAEEPADEAEAEAADSA